MGDVTVVHYGSSIDLDFGAYSLVGAVRIIREVVISLSSEDFEYTEVPLDLVPVSVPVCTENYHPSYVGRSVEG